MTPNRTAPEMMCELFKLLRSRWLSRQQLAADLGVTDQTATRWVAELGANGMLRERQAPSAGQKGVPPMIYTLAEAWGGQAT